MPKFSYRSVVVALLLTLCIPPILSTCVIVHAIQSRRARPVFSIREHVADPATSLDSYYEVKIRYWDTPQTYLFRSARMPAEAMEKKADEFRDFLDRETVEEWKETR